MAAHLSAAVLISTVNLWHPVEKEKQKNKSTKKCMQRKWKFPIIIHYGFKETSRLKWIYNIALQPGYYQK